MLLARRPAAGTGEPGRGGLAAGFAALVVRGRVLVVVAWIGLAVAAVVWLPSPRGGGVGDLDDFAPEGNPYVATEIRSLQHFGFPLLARTVLVQHDPDGLSPYTQAQTVLRAAALSQQQYEDADPILGALPLLNTFGVFPGARQDGTTALTYLFMPPEANLFTQARAADRFAATHLSEDEDDFVGVTGSFPARVEQSRVVERSLRTVEVATVTAIFVLIAVSFRSLVAPLLTLVAAGLAFVLTLHLAGAMGQALGVSVPAELRPLLLALLLGVMTDYAVFFLAGTQHGLRSGQDRLTAVRGAATDFVPIVVVAGATVAAGTGCLLVAEGAVFRAFGPGMAITVLVAVAVSVTLVPALLAMLGPVAFWPSPARSEEPDEAEPRRRARFAVVPVPAVVRLTRRRTAVLVSTGCVSLLLLAAVPVRDLQLGLSFVPSLPPTNSAAVASQAAQAGFSEGILSPTVVLVEADQVTDRTAALSRLRQLIAADPGVAGVLGPGQGLLDTERGIVLAEDGDAARFLVVMADQPLGATAIATFDRLEQRLPAMLDQVGLQGATASLGGDTALASLLTASTRADLARIAVAVLAVNLLILVAFLRALVLPLYLLATSVLSLLAALGLTTLLFQGVLDHDGLTFYVPFAAAVLLIALGSDYNIFGVGHVWHEARHRPLRQAVIDVVPRTSRAINTAAVTLAVSFGLLALVPLDPFRELAFVMAVGILLDAVVVRTVLVPTLLVLFGRWNRWPARADLRPPVPDTAVTEEREVPRAPT